MFGRIKSFLLVLLVAAATFTLAACHDEGNDDMPTRQASKTVFMYLPYTGRSNNLYTNFLQNISDIETAIVNRGGLGNNKMLVYIAPSPTSASLIDIVYRRGQCVRDTLKTYSAPDFTSATSIAAVLEDVKKAAPAPVYGMIVGCHGEGWLPVSQTQRAKTRYFGGTSPEYQADITTLAEALQRAAMHLQFLLFDDCYLSTVEVAYDLRRSTDRLIASTSEIMAYGMPYERILPLLLDTPDYEAVCRHFLDFYEQYRYGGSLMNYGTLAVTDCTQLDALAAFMRAVNAAYTFDTAELDSLQDLDAAHWTPTIYFDLADYVAHLCHDDAQVTAELDAILSRLVVSKAATASIYSNVGNTTIPLKAFSGLAVSDPSVNALAQENKTLTAWWKATH